ncbi:hypothetical protein ACFRCI_36090 [Streptomyces sp. NPDC056638]
MGPRSPAGHLGSSPDEVLQERLAPVRDLTPACDIYKGSLSIFVYQEM